MRIWQWLLVSVVVIVLGLGGYVFLQIRSLTVDQITNDLYVIYGLGGNVAVLDTDEGTVIVDTMALQYQGECISRGDIFIGATKTTTMVRNRHRRVRHCIPTDVFWRNTLDRADASIQFWILWAHEEKPEFTFRSWACA